MAETTTIIKNPRLRNDENYDFLRSEGLKYIEELGSTLWTDYNEHDPGITILEALCYSITELAYRTSLPMNDLLADETGHIDPSQALFTAKDILTQAPLTINDYRKLLIDIKGVHNAWLYPDNTFTTDGKTTEENEMPFFADCAEDKLSFEITPHPVNISGLYKVLLDLDDDAQAGNLNDGSLEILSPAISGYNAGAVSFTVIFPAWNQMSPYDNLFFTNGDSLASVIPVITADGNNWKIFATFSYKVKGDDITVYNATVSGIVIVDMKPSSKIISLTDMEAFFSPLFTQQILNLYIYKIQEAKRIVQTATKTLHENRNLCEDFVNIDTITNEEIAICCDIDITPDTDMDEVQANVFYAIKQYLNPSVSFYLLKDMMDKGYTADKIFEGPRLNNGFIDTNELEKTDLRKNIYASDIISLIMDIKGVQAVRGFLMTKYDQNGQVVKAERNKAWCMSVTSLHKPVFSETRSKVLFFKNNFPYRPALNEVRDTLRWLNAVNGSNKLNGRADDLLLPVGNFTQLDAYTSIRHLFPQTYGIGTAGLAANANNKRKAQAKQLKAYLLFYDQLLADFFSQLKNAKALFSTDDSIQTYFAQYLVDINDTDPVYKKVGGNSLLEEVLNNHDSSSLSANQWQNLYESNTTFIDRRNRFLDHLMARFAESFNDYVLLMYSLDFETQKEIKLDPAHLILNKADFLKTYPQVSYGRTRAFNYFPQKEVPAPANFEIDTSALWDTENVSGLEKKVARLSGISNVYRRFLYCFTLADIILTEDSPAKYKFVFTDKEKDKSTDEYKNVYKNTITSTASFDYKNDALAAAASFIDIATLSEHYSIELSGDKYHVLIKDNDGNVQGISKDFEGETEAINAIDVFRSEFNRECDPEGLHLVEHILLRPRGEGFLLPAVCLDATCDFCGEQDPFSFRLSVVLPFWPNRFKNLSFRDYFENMVRMEAPANTLVKICWLGNMAMMEFEVAYKEWLEALANYAEDNTTISTLEQKNNILINIIFNLHSEYPVATLHDCDEGQDTNPVMLGRTILGSFKTQ